MHDHTAPDQILKRCDKAEIVLPIKLPHGPLFSETQGLTVIGILLILKVGFRANYWTMAVAFLKIYINPFQ